MIWKRTPAGEAELKTHAAGLRAAAQNVLMILDGVKTEQMLLTNLAGVTREDFRALIQLGLIEPAEPDLTPSTSRGAEAQATATGATTTATAGRGVTEAVEPSGSVIGDPHNPGAMDAPELPGQPRPAAPPARRSWGQPRPFTNAS